LGDPTRRKKENKHTQSHREKKSRNGFLQLKAAQPARTSDRKEGNTETNKDHRKKGEQVYFGTQTVDAIKEVPGRTRKTATRKLYRLNPGLSAWKRPYQRKVERRNEVIGGKGIKTLQRRRGENAYHMDIRDITKKKSGLTSIWSGREG